MFFSQIFIHISKLKFLLYYILQTMEDCRNSHKHLGKHVHRWQHLAIYIEHSWLDISQKHDFTTNKKQAIDFPLYSYTIITGIIQHSMNTAIASHDILQSNNHCKPWHTSLTVTLSSILINLIIIVIFNKMRQFYLGIIRERTIHYCISS